MKAIFDGQDHTIMLERASHELLQLKQGKKLTAKLTRPWGGAEWDKIASLELKENKAIDGIELMYLPEDAENWEVIEQVRVRLNNRAYNFIEERGEFGTRYNGEDKIKIVNGYPEEWPEEL
jgi:hypothetical protein